jgi:D-beta-D-heptose 7-phosphate kinase/D-beta-D-heptose 1-phosphate adenosyltransferase
MTASLLRVIGRFAGRRVLVLGDAMLDSYLMGRSTRLCQEAPVPVVAVHECRDCPGGATNTAVNLAALGCQVDLLAVVGDDQESGRLCDLLRQHGVGTGLLTISSARKTLAKQRIVNGDHLLARIDQGDTGPIPRHVERRVLARLDAAFVWADAVVISDYGYGVLTPALLSRLRTLQERFRQMIAVDARDLTRYRAIGVTVAKPNFEEALRLAGHLPGPPGPHERSRADLAADLGVVVRDRSGARIAAITLDVDGAVVVECGGAPHRTYADPVDAAQTAGAGDTYLAALTLALASGATTSEAADLAAGAASVVVARAATATCSADDLRRALDAAASARTPARGRRDPEIDEKGDGRDDAADLGVRRATALRQA